MGSFGNDAQQVFQIQKASVKQFIKNLQLENTRAGFLTYGKSASVQYEFGELPSLSNAVTMLERNVGNPNDGHNVAEALKVARTNLFKLQMNKDAFGVRKDASKLLILFITKAISTADSAVEIAKLKQEDVKLVIVAIGNNVDRDELKIVAGEGVQLIFLDDKELMKKDVDVISKQSITGKKIML